MLGEIRLIDKNLHAVYGIDEYIFSNENAAVIATCQIAACQETLQGHLP